MANDILQIGNKMEIQLVKGRTLNPEDEAPVYISQFMEWSDATTAIIALPFYKGQLVALQMDGVYLLRFFTKNGLYQCKAVVVNRARKLNNIAVAELKFVSALEKFQRRQFYRMNCIMPVKYAVITPAQSDLYFEWKNTLSKEYRMEIQEKIDAQNITFQMGTALDISGGGIRFNSTVQNQPDDMLVLMPDFPEQVQHRVPFLFGRVISSRKILNKEQSVYDNRVEFIRIRSSEQELIITYIFQEERKRRKHETEIR